MKKLENEEKFSETPNILFRFIVVFSTNFFLLFRWNEKLFHAKNVAEGFWLKQTLKSRSGLKLPFFKVCAEKFNRWSRKKEARSKNGSRFFTLHLWTTDWPCMVWSILPPPARNALLYTFWHWLAQFWPRFYKSLFEMSEAAPFVNFVYAKIALLILFHKLVSFIGRV